MVQKVLKPTTPENEETLAVKDNTVFRKVCAIIQDKCYNINPYGRTSYGTSYDIINIKCNINPEDTVYKLSGRDDFTMASLSLEAEQRFNIYIPDTDYEKFLYKGTVADWCNYIGQLIQQQTR